MGTPVQHSAKHKSLPDHLSPTLSEALREAKERLQDIYGECLRRLILYGSHARGKATEDSDVDMLVVLRGPVENSYEEVKPIRAF